MPLLPPQNTHNLVGKRDSGERIGNELEGEPQEKRSAVRMSDKVVRQIIHTPDAPQAIGPYSQAVRIGNRLLLSGSLGIDPKTGQFPDGGITEQTHQSLKNIGEVLKAAGAAALPRGGLVEIVCEAVAGEISSL
ncbi:hypothetical protein WR25_02091 [Diploscapter pachys]|uniref:Uncharacterized protein n=1 Tax=Diploscapter pachys TaxID=2018661 RepID=A0A2A2K707_9BILA|nr:hypothetical protein WR25_02091 [Diploscapter pachys]